MSKSKRAQGTKAQLYGGAPQTLASEETKVGSEIVALQFLPGRGLLLFLVVPFAKFQECLAVIALRVRRSPAIRREVNEKFLDPLVTDFSFCGTRFCSTRG